MKTITLIIILLQISLVTTQTEEYAEMQKIETLISAVENLKNAKFYRNGKLHDAEEAAEHLRKKLRRAGNRITTAEEFIEHLASKSLITGRKYKIIFNDEKEVDADVFFYSILEINFSKKQEKQ